MGTPRSVRAIDAWPYPNNKWRLGTRLHKTIELVRELVVTHLTASGGGTLDLTNGLRDVLDNIVLSNPTIIQNTGGGGNTQMEISAATDYKIAGVFKQKAATQDIATTAGMNTGASQYRSVLVELDAAGAVSFVISAIAAAAPVALPAKTVGKCAIASIQIPASFTSGTTAFATAWVTNGVPIGASALTATALDPPESLPDTDG
jgi:hypothetical protein